MKVLAVIPTYNERDNLPELVRTILKNPDFSVMVVDDGSPDGTGAIADQLAAEFSGRVDVLHRTGKRGLGRSYVDGLRRALAQGTADLICQMDADWSHDPKFLPDMAAACENADVVIGSRYLNGVSVINWPLQRIILSAFANRYIRAVTGLRTHDCTSGFRCWRREMLAKLPTLVAWIYKYRVHQPYVYPRNDLDYAANFLHLMFSLPAENWFRLIA